MPGKKQHQQTAAPAGGKKDAATKPTNAKPTNNSSKKASTSTSVPSTKKGAPIATATSSKAATKSKAPVAAAATPVVPAIVAVKKPTTPAKPATSVSPFYPKNSLTVIATYHSVLAGIVLRGNKFKLKFSTKHHVGCVNTVAVSEKFIASAGSDERIFLFTCKDKGAHCSDLGSLTPPAEVTCLAFPGGASSYLVCGCGDGSLLVYKTRDWDCQFHLPKLHDKAIRAFAFHPMGGRVGVTVGADRTVALLNMVAGKLISKTRLPVYTPSLTKAGDGEDPIPQGALLAAAAGSSVPIAVQFSAGAGELVFITMPLVVFVFHSMTFTLVCKIELPIVNPDNQICSSCVVGERTIVIGCENGVMRSATVTEEIYRAYLDGFMSAAEEKSKPSLSSLAVKQAEAESEEESEAGSDEESSEEDENENLAVPANATKKQIKSAFEKPSVPADSGRMRHIPDSEGPYLQHSKNAATKADNKKIADQKEQARRAQQKEDEEAIPRLRFSAPLSLCVPAEIEESQKHVPYQHKRKHPTGHGARVRSIVCQDPNYRFDVVPVETKATKAALGKKRVRMDDDALVESSSSAPAFPGIATDCVLVSADTEGCLIAWRVALKAHMEGSATNTPIQALHYVASCNCSGRVTEIASMMQE